MSLLTGSEGAGQSGTTQGQGNPQGGSNEGGSSSEGGASGSAAGSQTSWFDTLPSDLKENQTLKQFKDVGSLAKSYLHANSLIGKKGIIPPGEKATEEEMNQFYTSLGRPSFDKYEVKAPEGAEVNKAAVDWFKENAYKLGLLPKQAQGLLEQYLQFESSQIGEKVKNVEIEQKNQLDGLKKEWGQGFNKQVAMARLAVKELGGEEFTSYLETTGLGNDVSVIKFMANVGKLLGEDKLRGEDLGQFGKTPKEIQAEIAKIRENPQSPYYDKSHPGHNSVVAQMEDLYKQLMP